MPFFAENIELPQSDIMKSLGDFWRGRIETMLEERGVPYDTRGAAIGARIRVESGAERPGWIDPTDCLARAQALAAFRQDPRFEPLTVLFKRVANILKSVTEALPGAVDSKLFEDPAENALLQAYERALDRAEPLWSKRAYTEIIPVLLEMEAAIHTFFDDVLVNAEKPDVRRNRLRLLTDVRALFVQGWDLSQVVLEGDTNQAETTATAAR